mgnify:CR=1 FL=1|jgi:hypothetical protein|tara:strand:+ start:7088 stop:7810 length:723 start_codon:yes stop_codon:yes gene_type:complete
MTDMTRKESNYEAIEQILTDGNLQALTPQQRVEYVQRLCESVGVNPMTRPFQFIKFQGKAVLYATKACTDQLRKIHGVSIEITRNVIEDGCIIVHAKAIDASGRVDEDMGVIDCERLRGDAMVNARMKALTKAKRRVTLSICGLSVLDESELHSMPQHERVTTPAPAEEKSSVDPRDALRAIKAKIEEGRPKVKPKPVAVAPKKAAPKKVAPETVEAVVSASSAGSFEYEPIPEIPGGVS